MARKIKNGFLPLFIMWVASLIFFGVGFLFPSPIMYPWVWGAGWLILIGLFLGMVWGIPESMPYTGTKIGLTIISPVAGLIIGGLMVFILAILGPFMLYDEIKTIVREE